MAFPGGPPGLEVFNRAVARLRRGVQPVLTDHSPGNVLHYLSSAARDWEVKDAALRHLGHDPHAPVLRRILRERAQGADDKERIIDLVASTDDQADVFGAPSQDSPGVIRFKIDVRRRAAPIVPGWVGPLSVAGTIELDGSVRIFHFGPGGGAW